MTSIPTLLIAGVDLSQSEDFVSLLSSHLEQSNIIPASDLKIVRRINNVYYSADIALVPYSCHLDVKEDDLEFIDAIIFYIDHPVHDPVHELKTWMAKLRTPVETILIVYKDHAICYEESVKLWCIKNGCEIVQLGDRTENSMEENEVKEKTGINRVIEVLHTHQWTNMSMKKNIKPAPDELSTSIIAEELTESKATDANDYENMSVLFQNLLTMKQSLSFLSPSERAKRAGEIAELFLRAMGENEEDSDDGVMN